MTERDWPKSRWLGKGLYILSLGFLAFGLFGIGWVVWPNPREAVTINLPEGELAGAPLGGTYASLTDYTLSVTWPRWLSAGEEGRISVLITEDEEDRVQASDRPVQVVSVIPAMVPLSIKPTGQIQAGVGSGQDLALDWQISGSVPGDYPGEVIVSFEFYDEAISGMVSVPVAVVDIEVKIIRLFGLQSQMVLWFGLIGLVFWGTLFVLGRDVQPKKRLR